MLVSPGENSGLAGVLWPDPGVEAHQEQSEGPSEQIQAHASRPEREASDPAARTAEVPLCRALFQMPPALRQNKKPAVAVITDR